MLLFPYPALLTPFSKTFIIKGNANNRRNSPSGPFPDITFINKDVNKDINEEPISAIDEAVIGAIIAQDIHLIFISCFTISVAPSIYRPDLSSDSTVLITSSLSSFELNKVNPFPALTASCPHFSFKFI